MLPVESGYVPTATSTLPTGATAPAELSPAQQQALAERYAPILYFHPDEQNFLQDPNTFIEQSSLREERDWRPDKELHDQGDVPPEVLAEIGPENATADGQVFLDHDDDARAGDLGNSQNLYQYDPETNTITYYFFYSYNDGPPGVGDVQNHEGDWERITVHLDENYQPTEIHYAAHNGLNSARSWAEASTEDGRPVVYVGQGSHASLPEPGEWSTNFPGVNDLASDDGLRFDLATRPAVDVTTQPWYGSHVLWGERGSAQEVGVGDTSGPTGPSPEKGPVVDGSSDRQRSGSRESAPDAPSFPFPFPQVPGIDVPGIDLPDIDLPDINVPDIDLPDIDLPDVDLPGPL